jgi:hypothetical protein
LDVGAKVTQSTQILLTPNQEIMIINQDVHPIEREATILEIEILRKSDIIDEREILTVGGVSVNNAYLNEVVRRFNRESKTHRAVVVDYAETGEWEGSAVRLRADLVTGRGPDVLVFNQWGDENDITSSLMRGGFLADMNVMLENDPILSREDFFENILDVWTNDAGELSLITGAVEPNFFWGPSEKLDGFNDFTHKGFLNFLRTAKAQGVTYPAGLGFTSIEVLRTMLFADDTFICYTSGRAYFDKELFLDILTYAKSVTYQQALWEEATRSGEALAPIPYFARNEQLMTRMFGLMSVNSFRKFDAAVGGLTPIGAPNSAGNLAITISPIWRMGIRANSQNSEAAWEFIRTYVLHINSGGWISGIPIIRSHFEDEIQKAIQDDSYLAFGSIGIPEDIELPAFTEECIAVLRNIMESITHEYFPDPHIFNIVLEETAPFFAGVRSAEDAARIIQSRVSRYLSELS